MTADKRIRLTPLDLIQLVTIIDRAIYGGPGIEAEAKPMLAKAIHLRNRLSRAHRGKTGRPAKEDGFQPALQEHEHRSKFAGEYRPVTCLDCGRQFPQTLK